MNEYKHWLTNNWRPQPIVRTRRQFTIKTAVYLLFLSGVFFMEAYQALDAGLILKVTTFDKKLASYKHQQLTGNNYFISGMKGDLYWKPHTLTESMLLITADRQGIDLFDVTGIFITAGIVFFMVPGSGAGSVFSKNLASGFFILIMVVAIIGISMDAARMLLAIKYIPYLTHRQFKIDYTIKILSYNYMVYPILLYLIIIPQKVIELQKEAELTI